MRLFALLLLASFGSACRTPVTAKAKTADAQQDVYVKKECDVRVFEALTDLPEGATNLGQVRVAKVKGTTDEEMYVLLLEEVCKLGGDGVSSRRWVKSLGKISGPPTELEATAWTLP